MRSTGDRFQGPSPRDGGQVVQVSGVMRRECHIGVRESFEITSWHPKRYVGPVVTDAQKEGARDFVLESLDRPIGDLVVAHRGIGKFEPAPIERFTGMVVRATVRRHAVERQGQRLAPKVDGVPRRIGRFGGEVRVGVSNDAFVQGTPTLFDIERRLEQAFVGDRFRVHQLPRAHRPVAGIGEHVGHQGDVGGLFEDASVVVGPDTVPPWQPAAEDGGPGGVASCGGAVGIGEDDAALG